MSEITTKHIGELPAATTVGNDDLLVIEQSGVAKKAPNSLVGNGFPAEAKQALYTLLENVAYIDSNGQTYLDALKAALRSPAELVSISAVFTQGSATIYPTTSLNSLKQYLVVTATYIDGETATVTTYTLSGTLAVGVSTVTVAYNGKTTTFTVVVTDGSANTTAQIAKSGKILAHNNTTYFEADAPTGSAITVIYDMPNATNVLYPAGIIPTDSINTMTMIGQSGTKACLFVYDDNGNALSYVNEVQNTFNRWVQNVNSTMFEFSQSWTLSDGQYTKIAFTVDSRYIDEAYMYDKTTGHIWFAGINTPYYGLSNVSELAGIPYGFQQVQYLESNNENQYDGAYIRSGKSFSDPTAVEYSVTFEPFETDQSWTAAQCVIGARQSKQNGQSNIGAEIAISSNQGTGFGMWSGSPGAYAVPSSWYAEHDAVGTWSSTAVTFKLDNGEVVTSTQTTRTCTGEISVFGLHSYESGYPGATYLYKGKIYSAAAKQDGTTIFDLVPIRRKTDNKPAFYDTVNKAILYPTASGSGSASAITAGADVTGV